MRAERLITPRSQIVFPFETTVTENDQGARWNTLHAGWFARVGSFVAEQDFHEFETLVAEHYLPSTRLWVAVDAAGKPCGFMGLSEAHVDALFIAPATRGQGVGRPYPLLHMRQRA